MNSNEFKEFFPALEEGLVSYVEEIREETKDSDKFWHRFRPSTF
jgi:hypothetical protein